MKEVFNSIYEKIKPIADLVRPFITIYSIFGIVASTSIFTFIISIYAVKSGIPALDVLRGLSGGIIAIGAAMTVLFVVMVLMVSLPGIVATQDPAKGAGNRAARWFELSSSPILACLAFYAFAYREYLGEYPLYVLVALSSTALILVFSVYKRRNRLKDWSFAFSYISVSAVILLTVSYACTVGLIDEKSASRDVLNQIERILGSSTAVYALALASSAITIFLYVIVTARSTGFSGVAIAIATIGFFAITLWPGGLAFVGMALKAFKAGADTPVTIVMKKEDACGFTTLFKDVKCDEKGMAMSESLPLAFSSDEKIFIREKADYNKLWMLDRKAIVAIRYQ